MKWKWEEFSKWFWEFFYYLVGAGMEGSKGGGWKGALFIWPFLIILAVIVFLVVKVIFFQ